FFLFVLSSFLFLCGCSTYARAESYLSLSAQKKVHRSRTEETVPDSTRGVYGIILVPAPCTHTHTHIHTHTYSTYTHTQTHTNTHTHTHTHKHTHTHRPVLNRSFSIQKQHIQNSGYTQQMRSQHTTCIATDATQVIMRGIKHPTVNMQHTT